MSLVFEFSGLEWNKIILFSQIESILKEVATCAYFNLLCYWFWCFSNLLISCYPILNLTRILCLDEEVMWYYVFMGWVWVSISGRFTT